MSAPATQLRKAARRSTFHMLAALAEFERSLISERTKAGLAAERAYASTPERRSSSLSGAWLNRACRYRATCDPYSSQAEIGRRAASISASVI
ncbi:recombinase family protein [Hyphomicrobium sp.]|uniref:recombinase family protein n=1 Tax=Hyphomicrobium sp. TaxID=82 RepID=UPI0039C8B368